LRPLLKGKAEDGIFSGSNYHVKKAYRRRVGKSYSFIVSALDGGEWLASRLSDEIILAVFKNMHA
jgi:hypothetical protein